MTIREFTVQYALGTLDFRALRNIASDKRTSKKILTILSKDENNIVRYYVAKNPNTPKEIKDKIRILL